MAATLPDLCLRIIFQELSNDFISLHSCVLVNRHWCIQALPELWKNPFDAIKNSNINGIMEANIPLLNTYISCLSKDTRDNLGLKSNIQNLLFDYGVYLQYIHFKTIIKSIYLWLYLYKDGDPAVFKLKTTTKRRKVSNDSEDNILKALCEYFVNRSTRIKGVDLLDGNSLNIFEFPNAVINLSHIQHFKFGIHYNHGVVSSAAKIAKNISKLEIDLRKVPYSTFTRINNVEDLIKSQKNLKQILLNCSMMEFLDIIKSLFVHVETLTHITLRNIKFEHGFPLAELAEFLNLNYLEIDNCQFFNGKTIKLDLKAFRKLESILIKDTYMTFEIMKILCCQAKDRLHVLKLPADSTDFPRLETICVKFCPNIKKLVTSTKKSSFNHIISMLNACKNLEEIHIYEEQIDEIFSWQVVCSLADANRFFKTLGAILPKSVHTFIYNSSNWRFNSESLEIFLLQFQPKKFMLLEFRDCSFLSDEHLNVIIKFCGKTLKKLHISGKHNLHRMYVLERRHQFLGDLYVEKLNQGRLFIDNLMANK